MRKGNLWIKISFKPLKIDLNAGLGKYIILPTSKENVIIRKGYKILIPVLRLKLINAYYTRELNINQCGGRENSQGAIIVPSS